MLGNLIILIPLPPEGLELSVSTWFYMKEFEYKLGQWKSLLYIETNQELNLP